MGGWADGRMAWDYRDLLDAIAQCPASEVHKMNFGDKQATNYLNPSVIQLPKFGTFNVPNF